MSINIEKNNAPIKPERVPNKIDRKTGRVVVNVVIKGENKFSKPLRNERYMKIILTLTINIVTFGLPNMPLGLARLITCDSDSN